MSYPYLTDVLRSLGLDLPLPVPTFGLFVGIAFFSGVWLATGEARRRLPSQSPELMTNACVIALFAGIVGARLFHLLEYPREFLANPAEMIFSRSGFTIYGGLIVGMLAGLAYCRRKRAPLAPMLDAVAPPLMLAYAIGRIGCQISGDGDWGIAADLAAKPGWLPTWLWAQTYQGNIAGVQIPSPGVYPTPIYETLMSLAAFGILWALRKRAHASGWLFGVYLVLAGVERLLIEFIRVNTAYTIFGMEITQAQLISVACVVAGLIVMLWRAGTRPSSEVEVR